MLRIVICEDEPAQRAELEGRVQSLASSAFAGCQVRSVASAEELRALLGNGMDADIFLLDIQLGEADGVALAAELNRCRPLAQIIYITGYLEHCSRVYETEHVWFLVKPASDADLARAMKRAVDRLAREERRSITLSAGGALRKVAVRDILWAASTGRKIRLRTAEETIEFYGKLSELELRLGGEFIRCHQSFLANRRAVESIKGETFRLTDGTQIPISHSRFQHAREQYFDFLTLCT